MSDPGRQAQYRAGVAHREMQQAEFDAKLAEQDYVNLSAAHKAAQGRADELRIQTEVAKKKSDAARERLASARRAYEKEVSGIEKAGAVRQ